MSITQQQPITNLPSSLTPAPVTVVRTPNPIQPVPAYQAPSQNIMYQQTPTQQEGMAMGPTQHQQYATTMQAEGHSQQQDASGFPALQQVSLTLGDQPPSGAPQSTQVTSLPGAQYTRQQQQVFSPSNASPQMFTPVDIGAVSGLPVAPPTFSLPSVPPTISLGPSPSLSPSVSAQ